MLHAKKRKSFKHSLKADHYFLGAGNNNQIYFPPFNWDGNFENV